MKSAVAPLVGLLELLLCEAGPIAAVAQIIRLDRRAMAGIAEDDRFAVAGSIHTIQHRYILIQRIVGGRRARLNAAPPAVVGKTGGRLACEQPHRFEPRQCLIDRVRDRGDELLGHCREFCPVLVRNVEEKLLVLS